MSDIRNTFIDSIGKTPLIKLKAASEIIELESHVITIYFEIESALKYAFLSTPSKTKWSLPK